MSDNLFGDGSFKDRPDFQYIQNAAVNLIYSDETFAAVKQQLHGLNYAMLEIEWSDYEQFKVDITRIFHWQEQFGYEPWTGNMDALLDGFRGLSDIYGERICICLSGYDDVANDQADLADIVLDFIENESRFELLLGRLLIGLIRTENQSLKQKTFGARNPNFYF